MCWVFNIWQIQCQKLFVLFKKGKSQVRTILQNIFQEMKEPNEKNIAEY
jgi:hypothetical protein